MEIVQPAGQVPVTAVTLLLPSFVLTVQLAVSVSKDAFTSTPAAAVVKLALPNEARALPAAS